jgi:hypothetical protein
MPQGFIAYNMAHYMLTMTKHVEQDYAFLLKRLEKEHHSHSQGLFDWESTTKCTCKPKFDF